MRELDEKLISSARITVFNPRNVDRLVDDYDDQVKLINESEIENQNEWLEEAHHLYTQHLTILSNYVSDWTAGRESHKANATSPIDKSNKRLMDFSEKLTEELEHQDYKKNKEHYDWIAHRKKLGQLIQEIGMYRNSNRSLFYEKLIELYELDKKYFKKVYNMVEDDIANNSRVAKLRELVEEEEE